MLNLTTVIEDGLQPTEDLNQLKEEEEDWHDFIVSAVILSRRCPSGFKMTV